MFGSSYAATRRPDPRIGAQIAQALDVCGSVINVGAGAGSYEPPQTILAVDPSAVMIARRLAGTAPAVRATAEALPVADGAAEAAMALLTVHLWADVEQGLAEMRRIARRRIVIMTWDPEVTAQFWLLREYLPMVAALDQARAIPLERLLALLGGARVQPVLIPHDCTDGFVGAYWRRPEAYLEPVVRAGVSALARPGDDVLRPGLSRLADDLRSGRWHRRHGDLLDRSAFDAGYRLLVTELD